MGKMVSVPAELFASSGLSAAERMVLASLWSFTTPSGACSPSLAEIARAAGLAKRSVQNVLDRLEAGGRLRRTNRAAADRRREVCSYMVFNSIYPAGKKSSERDIEINTISPPDDGEGKLLANVALLWNLKLKALPPAGGITPALRRSFAARLAEEPERREFGWWVGFFDRAAANEWLCGGNPRGWQPDLAALLKNGARMKQIAQGTYGRRKTGAVCAAGNLADYVTRLGKANFGEDWRLEEWA